MAITRNILLHAMVCSAVHAGTTHNGFMMEPTLPDDGEVIDTVFEVTRALLIPEYTHEEIQSAINIAKCCGSAHCGPANR